MENKLIYLASPYTHRDALVKTARAKSVALVACKLMVKGMHVFSPIAHGVPIANQGDLPILWDYWEENCKVFLSRCQCLIVVMLYGWDESVGVLAEIKYAKSIGIPVMYLSPDSMELYNSEDYHDLYNKKD